MPVEKGVFDHTHCPPSQSNALIPAGETLFLQPTPTGIAAFGLTLDLFSTLRSGYFFFEDIAAESTHSV